MTAYYIRDDGWRVFHTSIVKKSQEAMMGGERSFHLLLETSRWPAFMAPRHWGIYVSEEGKRAALVHDLGGSGHFTFESVGKQVHEFFPPSAGEGGEGLVGGKVVMLPDGEWEELLRAGRALAIPVIPASDCIGLDGIKYAFRWHQGYSTSTFLWWCEGPVAWRPFTKWVMRLQKFLVRYTGADKQMYEE